MAGRRVSPEWAEGYACRVCGRPLRWLGRWRRFARRGDVPGWVDGRGGWHQLDAEPDLVGGRCFVRSPDRDAFGEYPLFCARCSRAFRTGGADRRAPPGPDEAPAGYWIGA